MAALPDNFDKLSPLDKRAAVEAATGLDWSEYSKLPVDVRHNMLLSLQGHTVAALSDEYIAAAASDARMASFSGFFSGLKFGGSTVLVLGVGALIYGAYVFREPLKKAVT